MTKMAKWLGSLGLALMLAGCASGPKPLPQCKGPWTPLNAPAEVHDGR